MLNGILVMVANVRAEHDELLQCDGHLVGTGFNPSCSPVKLQYRFLLSSLISK